MDYRMKRLYSAIFASLILLFFLPATAQVQLSDSASISLLTASPWNGAVYALFGHTAIRVRDDSTKVDAVFNYGFFDPSQPHFYYNFVRGKTDYILGETSFKDFLFEYDYKGQQVIEQEIALSTVEKQQLYDALFVNALPEDRGYRYNYFYDNCSTRPRDMIEKYTNGVIAYLPTPQNQTYRDLLHERLDGYSWVIFGIDLLIGTEADRTIDLREKMFLPSYLMDSFDGATIQKSDTLSYSLVKNRSVILSHDNEKNSMREQGTFTPLLTAFVLLVVSIMVSLIQIIKLNVSKIPKRYDTILFGTAGVAGFIIFFLMYFSEHPATNPNWNFVWLNLFALIAAVLFWVKSANRVVYFYHFINFALLTLFLLLWWFIPQQLPVATIPFSMSLWLRSASNLFVLRKKKLTNKRFTSSKYMKAGWGQ
jgi:hypothetical protein